MTSTPTPTPRRLVSTKHYAMPELESFQLMIETQLEKAHRSGLNTWWHSNDEHPVWLGAIWLTSTQYELRFTQGAGQGPVEPAKIGAYTPIGSIEHNPTIDRPVTDFMTAVDEVAERIAGDRSKRPEFFFGHDDAHYPSILITAAPQGDAA